MRVRGGAGTRRGTERAYLSRRASERESEAAILRRSGCSVEVEDLSPGQVELDGSPAGLMRVVSLGRAGRGRGESSSLCGVGVGALGCGARGREQEPGARARAHRIGRLPHSREQPPAQAPPAAVEEACRETAGRRQPRSAARRASRRLPVATGRRSQACTREGWHLARLPGLCSRRQARGSGRETRADCVCAPKRSVVAPRAVCDERARMRWRWEGALIVGAAR